MANLDRISEFRFTLSGVTAKMRAKKEEAETVLSRLRELAVALADIGLNVVATQGRVADPIKPEVRAEMRDRLLKGLS